MTTRSEAVETPRPYASGAAWRLESLTEREREVLLLLGMGLGNRRLTQELGIAERTVKRGPAAA